MMTTTRKAAEIIAKRQRPQGLLCSTFEPRVRCSTRALVGLQKCNSRGWFSSKSTTTNNSEAEEPFYGRPRRTFGQGDSDSVLGGVATNSIGHRIAIAMVNATTAFRDPTRADAVAALGEVTGTVTLRRIHDQMMSNPTGRLILRDRPVVSKSTIPYDKLIAEAPEDIDSAGEDLTFGQAYGAFLKGHGFDPDERDEVNFIEDETLAYIMLRYRQVCRAVVSGHAVLQRVKRFVSTNISD